MEVVMLLLRRDGDAQTERQGAAAAGTVLEKE